MTAASRFVKSDLRLYTELPQRISVSLHGSLAFTGKGHGTDRAISLGLLGNPQHIDSEQVDDILDGLYAGKVLNEGPAAGAQFDRASDIAAPVDHPFPARSTALCLLRGDADGSNILSRTYYSIGGGFIVAEDEMSQGFANSRAAGTARVVPYSFDSANSCRWAQHRASRSSR